jgi:hypothetical protein
MDNTLQGFGFKRSAFDHSLYHRNGADGLALVGVYVDDLTLAFSDLAALRRFKAQLSAVYKMTDLGELTHMIGLKVERDRARRRIEVGQEHKVKELLERWGMSESKPNKVPLPAKTSLPALDAASPDLLPPAEVTTYQSLLGSVNYLSVMTRPDITQAVNYLSRFQAHPGAAHMAALKGVLRYLRGAPAVRLVYEGGEGLKGFSDADWANDAGDRSSVTGYVFTLGGGPVS